MWKIKGCRGGVGVALEGVLMEWRTGPVPTKHLISLIKKNLGVIGFGTVGSQATCQLCTHLLSPTHFQALPSTNNNAMNWRGTVHSGKFSTRSASCSRKQVNAFEEHQRLTSQRCTVSSVTDHWPSCRRPLKSEENIQESVSWVLKWVIFGNSWKENQPFGALLYIWIKLMYVEGLPGLNALHIAGACKHICTVS